MLKKIKNKMYIKLKNEFMEFYRISNDLFVIVDQLALFDKKDFFNIYYKSTKTRVKNNYNLIMDSKISAESYVALREMTKTLISFNNLVNKNKLLNIKDIENNFKYVLEQINTVNSCIELKIIEKCQVN